MLNTAKQPKWIAMLVLVLLLATVFVVLSAWQFGQSRNEAPVDAEQTETPVELTEIYAPGRAITATEADRIVDLRGEFVEDTQVLVAERLREEEPGYWVVVAFAVEGSPGEEVIPVVRGWLAQEDFTTDDDVPAPSAGTLQLQGRLLPTEALGEGPRELPEGVLPSLSVAELINLWDRDSYSGFVVDFSGAAMADAEASPLEPVWVGPQPEDTGVNWLNLFYGVEWVVFAGFAFYLWWRLVKDAHQKQLEEERLDREWEEQWRREQLAQRQAAAAGSGEEAAAETDESQRTQS